MSLLGRMGISTMNEMSSTMDEMSSDELPGTGLVFLPSGRSGVIFAFYGSYFDQSMGAFFRPYSDYDDEGEERREPVMHQSWKIGKKQDA